MRVLGVDPGSRFMGYGVIEDPGSGPRHVGHGVLRVAAEGLLELRLKALFDGLTQLMQLYRPDVLAVEGVFTLKNARSALVLGHARGMALLVAAQHDVSVHEYAPSQVKKAVGAGGAGDKDAVARMVKLFLQLETTERADATDALAVAICHLNHGRTGQRAKPHADPSWRDRLSPAYRSAP